MKLLLYEGLNSTIKNLICYLPQPLSSETIVSSVSPLYSALQNTGEKCKIYLSTQKGEYPLTPSPIPCGIVGYSHTPLLCACMCDWARRLVELED